MTSDAEGTAGAFSAAPGSGRRKFSETALIAVLLLWALAGHASAEQRTIRLSLGFGTDVVTYDTSRALRADVERWIQRGLNDTTPVNFHLPCLNDPVQAPQYFWDGVTDDGGPDEG